MRDGRDVACRGIDKPPLIILVAVRIDVVALRRSAPRIRIDVRTGPGQRRQGHAAEKGESLCGVAKICPDRRGRNRAVILDVQEFSRITELYHYVLAGE